MNVKTMVKENLEEINDIEQKINELIKDKVTILCACNGMNRRAIELIDEIYSICSTYLSDSDKYGVYHNSEKEGKQHEIIIAFKEPTAYIFGYRIEVFPKLTGVSVMFMRAKY